jgi:hypothetical protein
MHNDVPDQAKSSLPSNAISWMKWFFAFHAQIRGVLRISAQAA